MKALLFSFLQRKLLIIPFLLYIRNIQIGKYLKEFIYLLYIFLDPIQFSSFFDYQQRNYNLIPVNYS